MKILYAIQGTGNGHLSRALDIVPCLRRRAKVDVLVSGTQGDLILPFETKYKLKGLSFIFGRSGGVDMFNTFFRNSTITAYREIKALPVENYDLVINDFEPISAWACKMRKVPMLALSHQAAVLSGKTPQPGFNDPMGMFFLKHYAPCTDFYGFHFRAYEDGIFTPVIRRQVREQHITDEGHYTVYLPSYSDEMLIKQLSYFKDVKWEVFSKHNKRPLTTRNIHIQSINNEKFIKSMASSSGVLCGAGFETPSECLFLGKKLMVIPMKNQFEQHLNAAALDTMGVGVMKKLNRDSRGPLQEWINDGNRVAVDYPEITNEVVDFVLDRAESKKSLIIQPEQFIG